jgi:hypothetical protein
MLIKNTVAELLRVENLDFTVLDKIKQVALALESDPQKANIIIQLAYAIVAARMCIHMTFASADTNRQ